MAQAVLRMVPRVIPCVRACVMALDLDAGEMSLLGVYAGGEMRLGHTWRGPLEGPWLDIVEELAQGRTHVATGALAPCPASPLGEPLQAGAIRTYIYAPLTVQGQLIGSLNLALPTAAPMGHEQESFIHGLADELAIGIRQVRLHQAVQEHADDLEREVRSRTAQLAASEARFRAIFEGAALGIALLDESGHIVASNSALEAMLGYSAGALHGTSFAVLADPRHPPADSGSYRELIAGKRASYAEQRRYLRQDGAPIYANVTLSSVQAGSESEFGDADRFAIALVEDVTEQRQAQAALVESEKMAIVGQLAASLAHEVNNPLQAVVGCLGLAQEVLEEGGGVGRYVDIALEEVERAVRVMRHIQDLSRRSDQHEREAADIGDLLDKVLLLTEKRSRDAGVEVMLSLADDLPALWVVPDQIQQLFLNLVLNALQAMPDGGQLRVHAVPTDAPAGVEVSFSDTGTGIPADVVPRLYQPFETTKVTGLGLGLYVCHTIVELHDGRITVDSHPGQGTTFAVWLPAT
jgi:PAS domain S-box-containing protein